MDCGRGHRSIYNGETMKHFIAVIVLGLFCLTSCSNPAASTSASNSTPPAPSKTPDAMQQKLQESAGPGATDCGRLEVHPADAVSKAASDCAMQASQNKHAFYVAYNMPGMSVGVAGNVQGILFTVQSQGDGPSAALTSGACPSELRVASSGRVTCFAPGDMGSMGAGHTAIPPGMPNPHAFPKTK